MVGLDYATRFPDLHDVGVTNGPFVCFVGCEDDAHSLHVSRKTRAVNCLSQVFDKSILFFGVFEFDL